MPSTFGKREREQTKRAKAEAKRQRRQQGSPGDTEGTSNDAADGQTSAAPRESTDDVLAMIAELHERYDAGTLGFEEFEARKAELMARIVVD